LAARAPITSPPINMIEENRDKAKHRRRLKTGSLRNANRSTTGYDTIEGIAKTSNPIIRAAGSPSRAPEYSWKARMLPRISTSNIANTICLRVGKAILRTKL